MSKVPFFDLKAQYAHLKEEIDQAIQTVLDSGQFVGGRFVTGFENDLAAHLEIEHVVGVGNGTDALFVALKALGIGRGDEVITPAWSWISTAETISLCGATPIFAEVDSYYTIDPQDVQQKITPRTRAVMAVHLYGQMADMSALQSICREHKLLLLEDCAQAHFSSVNGRLAGTWGDVAAFSFYPTKNLGALGDAGAIATADPLLAEKARRFANHGGLFKDDHQMEGMNSRLDTLQAAILSVKLRHIDRWNTRRSAHAARYQEQLQGLGDLLLPKTRLNSAHTFHLFVIRTKKRNILQSFLKHQGIDTQVHYPKALPFEPAYQKFNFSVTDFPVSVQLQEEVLSLPIFPELVDDQIDFVCESIKLFFKNM